MATRSLGTLTLDLIAKTAGFTQGLSKAERESAKWRRQVERDAKKVGTALKTGVALGVGAAAASFVYMVQSTRSAIDEQAKMAQRLRTTSDSLATLTRAGDLAGVSLQQIEAASRTLEVNTGKAAQGVGAQAEAFDRLNLSAQELANLTLDERINAINTAIQANIPEFERAAVAADLFGSRGATAIQQLNPDVIAQAAKEVQVFGVNLSDIDAAKVELANDAISTLQLATKGIAQQLTVAAAPAIQAFGQAFFDAAEDAGGANNLIAESFGGVVRGAAFVVDAADGIGRAFKIAADAAIIAVSTMAARVATDIGNVVTAINFIPGVNFDETEKSLRDFAALQSNIAKEAGANIKRNLEDPLAGSKYVALFEEAKKNAQATAEAAVKARQAASAQTGGGTGTPTTPTASTTAAKNAAQEYIQTLQTQRAELGKNSVELGLMSEALAKATPAQLAEAEAVLQSIAAWEQKAEATKAAAEAQKAINDEAENIRLSMRSEEQVIRDSYKARHDIVVNNTKITGQAQQKLLKQLADERDDALSNTSAAQAEQARQDQLASQVESIRHSLLTEEQAIQESYNRRREIILQSEEETGQSHKELLLQLQEDRDAALREAEAQRQIVQLQNAETLFGNLAGLSKQFLGEESRTYQALFALEKSAAIARSIVAIQTGIANAFTQPYPANLIAAANVAGATANIVTTIKGTQLTGQAHDGLMSVPQTGTYLLEKGERVTTEKTSAKLDATLDQVQAANDGNGGMGGDVIINNNLDVNEMSAQVMGTAHAAKMIDNRIKANKTLIQRMAR